MKDTIGLFYEILQIAVGTRKSLSCQPSEKELVALYELSKKQALTAIAFAGLSKYLDSLGEASPYAGGVRGSMVYLKWLGLTAKVSQRNKQVSETCVELVRQYAHDGIATCILKGQGNLECYPEHLKEYRTSGDIDVWCKPMDEGGIDIAVSDLDGRGAHYEKYHGKEAVIEYVKMLWRLRHENDNENHEVRYHHIDAPSIGGVEIEAHFRPLFLDSPLRNWRLQRWFKENEQFGVHDFAAGADKTKTHSTSSGQAHKNPEGNVSNEVSEIVCEHPSSVSSSSTGSNTASSMPSGEKQEINRSGVIPVPTVSFNAVYQLCHIYRHLFDEGIGLRQLLDYYFVLRALHIEQGSLADRTESMAQWAEGMGIAVKSNEEIMHTLCRFGMKKFAGAVMYVIAKVFANDDDNDTLRYDNWASRWPWMICEPNEKEGKFLLNEIMQAGNFGKYDTRISHSSSQMGHAWEKLKHNMRLVRHYPEEVLWEPFFRIYHFLWRKFRLWRY